MPAIESIDDNPCKTAAEAWERARRVAALRRAGYARSVAPMRPPCPEPTPTPLAEQLSEALPPRVRRIVAASADYFHIAQPDMLSQRRGDMRLSLARQVAYYLIKKRTTWSLPTTARRFGGRDHTTILHGVHKIETLVALGDRVVTAAVNAISTYLETGVRNFPPPPAPPPPKPKPEPKPPEALYPPRKWTDEEVAELRRLQGEGFLFTEIGKRLFRSADSVFFKWRTIQRKRAKMEANAQ